MRNIAFLSLSLVAGCAALSSPAPENPPAVVAPSVAVASAPTTPIPAPAAPIAPSNAPANTQKPAIDLTRPVEKSAAPQKPPAKTAADPKAVAKAPATLPPPAASAAKVEAAPHLDLKGLEQRLKGTDAIGTFTKIALKNQVDDLLGKFRAFHDGRQPPTLPELRQPYELLIMKVLSLLQKADPALADDVARSREAIWGVLADKNRFAAI